jgi:hypothetical protein
MTQVETTSYDQNSSDDIMRRTKALITILGKTKYDCLLNGERYYNTITNEIQSLLFVEDSLLDEKIAQLMFIWEKAKSWNHLQVEIYQLLVMIDLESQDREMKPSGEITTFMDSKGCLWRRIDVAHIISSDGVDSEVELTQTWNGEKKVKVPSKDIKRFIDRNGSVKRICVDFPMEGK